MDLDGKQKQTIILALANWKDRLRLSIKELKERNQLKELAMLDSLVIEKKRTKKLLKKIKKSE